MRRGILFVIVGMTACGSTVAMETSSGPGGTGGSGTAGSGTAGSGTAGTGAACSGAAVTTEGVECSYSYDAFNASPSVNATSKVAWSCSGTTRSMTSNGLPDHDVGTFPNSNCPNTISAYQASASMPLTPVNTGTASNIQIVGYALNGVKFDPSTAGTCWVSGSSTQCSLIGNTGTWNIEALGQSSFNFGVDDNNAHVQPTGQYHYHGMPNGVIAKIDASGTKPVLVGFALDGFPVYARYGHTDPMDATSPVKAMKGSYQLKATADAGRPPTSTYPMGAFTQDYEYVAGSGDLDECNGRTDVTPEFPCGIYHYYITDTYPFIQRCVKGTPSGGMEMMGTGGGGGMPGNPPKCAPGQTMCCGDGICGGPENHTNCPEDCP